MIDALAKDKNLWTIATAPIAGDVMGTTDYNVQVVPGGYFVAGGTLRIEGDAGKYAKATQQTGVPITYRTILAHEAGHAVGNLLFERFGPLGPNNRPCDDACALGPTNAYRAQVGLPLLILRR